MVIPFMSIYCIQELHFSILEAGTIMTLFGVGSISGAFVGGKLTDRIGFYDLQVSSLFTGGILFIVLCYQHTFFGMAAGALILSFCNESFRPANQTAIAHYSNEENRTRSYSLNRLAVNLGWGVGGALGGFLAAINYRLLFWADGCTNLLAAVLLLLLMPRSAVKKTIEKPDKNVVKASPYKDKVYLFFIFLATLFCMCFYEFVIIEPVFFKIRWHFSERLIGSLMAMNGIIIAVTEMVLVHSLEGKRNKIFYIAIGTLITGLAYSLFNVMPVGLSSAIFIVVLVTIGEMLSMPFMNSFWISRTNTYNRGSYAALYAMAWAAAQILSPYFGSRLIDYGGFPSLWWVMAALSVVATFGYWLLYRNVTAKETSQRA